MKRAILDDTSPTIRLAGAIIGAFLYFANVANGFPKERLEVFTEGRVLQLDNYRRLTGFGWPGFKKMNLWRQDKGQKACAAAFLNAVQVGGPCLIPIDETLEISRVSIEVAGAV